ncbi:MAG: hypothetical protein CM1200mP20_14210 [Pseudomonadota bacterium]|nr:MAG: hypothetical protein CM1200mP20_14210 [Pseudomonadota bacterium]
MHCVMSASRCSEIAGFFWHRSRTLPVFGTMASNFNDPGVTALYHRLCKALEPFGLPRREKDLGNTPPPVDHQTAFFLLRANPYLSEVAESVRSYKQGVSAESLIARECQQLRASAGMLEAQGLDSNDLRTLAASRDAQLSDRGPFSASGLSELVRALQRRIVVLHGTES